MTRPVAPDPTPTGYNPRRRPRWWLVALIVGGHLLLGLLLMRVLAPDFTQRVVEQAGRGFTVIITTPVTITRHHWRLKVCLKIRGQKPASW